MWLSSTVSTDFFPKRKKNLLLQQAMELILRMVAKLAISGLVSRSLGEKAFVFKRHEKTATNTLNVIWKQILIVSWDLRLWPAVSGPHVLVAVGHTTQVSGLHRYTLNGAGARPALWECAWPCEEIYCLTVLSSQDRQKLQTSTHARLLTIHKSGLVSCSVFEITSVLGLLQLFCAARSHGW